MDELTDLIDKVLSGLQKMYSLHKSIEKRKEEIKVAIRNAVDIFFQEDLAMEELFSEATYITRENVAKAIFASDKNWNLSKHIYNHFCNDLQEEFDPASEDLVEEFNCLRDVGKIIQLNKQDILTTIDSLNHLKLGIIPILYRTNMLKLVRIDGDDSGFYFFPNRGIDFNSFKNRKDIRRSDLDNYFGSLRRGYVPDKEYVVMFVESDDNDMLYEEELIENGFMKMDVYTAIFIYRITGTLFKDIYLTNPDKQKQEYCFSLGWVTGKCYDENRDNPTIRMYYDDGVSKRNKRYKFIKVFELP